MKNKTSLTVSAPNNLISKIEEEVAKLPRNVSKSAFVCDLLILGLEVFNKNKDANLQTEKPKNIQTENIKVEKDFIAQVLQDENLSDLDMDSENWLEAK